MDELKINSKGGPPNEWSWLIHDDQGCPILCFDLINNLSHIFALRKKKLESRNPNPFAVFGGKL